MTQTSQEERALILVKLVTTHTATYEIDLDQARVRRHNLNGDSGDFWIPQDLRADDEWIPLLHVEQMEIDKPMIMWLALPNYPGIATLRATTLVREIRDFASD